MSGNKRWKWLVTETGTELPSVLLAKAGGGGGGAFIRSDSIWRQGPQLTWYKRTATAMGWRATAEKLLATGAGKKIFIRLVKNLLAYESDLVAL